MARKLGVEDMTSAWGQRSEGQWGTWGALFVPLKQRPSLKGAHCGALSFTFPSGEGFGSSSIVIAVSLRKRTE